MLALTTEGMSKTYWEHFSHGADIGVRGFGRTVEEAFEQAALALTAVVADIASVDDAEEIGVNCGAPDAELLLAEWLNELVFQMATRRMLFSRFELCIESGRLTGKAWGERIDAEKHEPAVEVKGATYTELAVSRSADGTWVAQCVVDV